MSLVSSIQTLLQESVDTPMVERRKNWFQRQVQRMSSIRRSSSTTYSSGLFGGNRSRHNSVYATPNEGGVLPGAGQYPPALPHQPHKMSIYDRIIRRKSTRRGIFFVFNHYLFRIYNIIICYKQIYW